MARPVSIQRSVLLDAARKVFLAQGFKASTALVAREAGVSEGSLFKHFKTKDDLFLAAMDTEYSGLSWQELLKRSVGRGSVRSTLEKAGLEILQHLRVVLPRIIMVNSSGILLTGPEHCRKAHGSPALKKLQALAAYFRAETSLGRLTMTRPEVHAQIFIGSLMYYVMHEILFNFRPATPKAYVQAVAALMVGNAGKQTTQPSRRSRKAGTP